MATTSTKAFNDMLEQFVQELIQTFPSEKCLKKYALKLDLLRKTNPKRCVTKFMKRIQPYGDQIMKKDESFFVNAEQVPEFMDELNIAANWTAELPQTTKDAIWQYLQTLYMLGMTITSIPPETMTMIEAIAKQCADKMGSGDAPGDPQALMASLSGMSGLFGNLLTKN